MLDCRSESPPLCAAASLCLADAAAEPRCDSYDAEADGFWMELMPCIAPQPESHFSLVNDVKSGLHTGLPLLWDDESVDGLGLSPSTCAPNVQPSSPSPCIDLGSDGCCGPIPCMATELEEQAKQLELGQLLFESSKECPAQNSSRNLPGCLSSTDVSALSSDIAKMVQSLPRPEEPLPPLAAPTCDATWVLQSAANNTVADLPASAEEEDSAKRSAVVRRRMLPAVPVALALRNSHRAAQAGVGMQAGAWKGCSKSSWCNRENRHRGLCNTRASIPGLAAYSASQLAAAGLSPAEILGESAAEGCPTEEETATPTQSQDDNNTNNENGSTEEAEGCCRLNLSLVDKAADSDGGSVLATPAQASRVQRMTLSESPSSDSLDTQCLAGPPPVDELDCQLLGSSQSVAADETDLSDDDSAGSETESDTEAMLRARLPPLKRPRTALSELLGAGFVSVCNDRLPGSAVAVLPPSPATPPKSSSAGRVALLMADDSAYDSEGKAKRRLVKPSKAAREGDGSQAKAPKKRVYGALKFPPPGAPPAPPGQQCTQCGTQATPVWRAGPFGPKTLCNACGVRYMKAGKCRVR